MFLLVRLLSVLLAKYLLNHSACFRETLRHDKHLESLYTNSGKKDMRRCAALEETLGVSILSDRALSKRQS